MVRKWKADPVFFCEHALGLRLWEKQQDALRAICNSDQVAIVASQKTGKSYLLAAAALWYVSTHANARVIFLSSVAAQLRAVNFRALGELYRGARIKLGGELHTMPHLGLQFPDGRCVVGLSAGTPEAAAGYSGANQLWLVDEASGVEDPILETVFGNAAGGAKVVLCGNPTRTAGKFFDAFNGSSRFWTQIRMNSIEASAHAKKFPGLARRDWIEQRREEWGEQSPFFRVRILGEFCDEDSSALIPISLISEAERRWNGSDLKDEVDRRTVPIRIGIDVARSDDGDETVFVLVRGRRFVTYPIAKRGLDGAGILHEVNSLLAKYWKEGEAQPVVIVDATGVGASPVDFLKTSRKWRTVPVLVAEKSSRPNEFANLRAEIAFGVRKWLELGSAVPKDSKLLHELASIRVLYDSKNRLQIEKKGEIKERIGRSPDRFDALALALYDPPKLVAPTRAVSQGIL